MGLLKLKYLAMIFLLSVITYLINGCTTNSDLIGASRLPLENKISMQNLYQFKTLPISITPENYISKKISYNASSIISLTIRNKHDTPLEFKYNLITNQAKSVNNELKYSCNAINTYRLLKPYESCFIDLIVQPKLKDKNKDDNYFIVTFKPTDTNEIYNIKYHTDSILSLLY